MGATSKYAFPWPAPAAFVKDGAAAIRSLAEAVETVLLPPLLATNSNGDPNWAAGAGFVPWDVQDNTLRKRGDWSTGGAAERYIVPPSDGWYLVSTSFRFIGQSAADTYTVAIETRDTGDDPRTGSSLNLWLQQQAEIPAQSASTFTQLAVTSLVRVQPAQVIQVRVAYAGLSAPPTSPAGANKLRVIKMSAL